MINVIASFEKEYEGPNFHALRGKLLKNYVEQVNMKPKNIEIHERKLNVH